MRTHRVVRTKTYFKRNAPSLQQGKELEDYKSKQKLSYQKGPSQRNFLGWDGSTKRTAIVEDPFVSLFVSSFECTLSYARWLEDIWLKKIIL